MKDIKTKERAKTVKVLNRAEHATYRAKRAYISTKEHLEKKDETSEEYAQNTVEKLWEKRLTRPFLLLIRLEERVFRNQGRT